MKWRENLKKLLYDKTRSKLIMK